MMMLARKRERKIMKKHLIATVNRVKLGHAVSSGFICEKIHFSKVMDQIINCSTLSTKTIKSMLYSDLKETDWSFFFASAHGKGPVEGQ